MGGHSFLWYTKWLKTSLFDNGVGGTVYFLLAKRINVVYGYEITKILLFVLILSFCGAGFPRPLREHVIFS
jgi:hypothetical protein